MKDKYYNISLLSSVGPRVRFKPEFSINLSTVLLRFLNPDSANPCSKQEHEWKHWVGLFYKHSWSSWWLFMVLLLFWFRWVFFSYVDNSILEIKCNFKWHFFNTETTVLSNTDKFKVEIITSYNNTKEKSNRITWPSAW